MRALTLLLLAVCLLAQSSQAAIARAAMLAHFHWHDAEHDHGRDHEHGRHHQDSGHDNDHDSQPHPHDHADGLPRDHDSHHGITTDHRHAADDDSAIYMTVGPDQPSGAEPVPKRLGADVQVPAESRLVFSDATLPVSPPSGEASAFSSLSPSPPERPPRA